MNDNDVIKSALHNTWNAIPRHETAREMVDYAYSVVKYVSTHVAKRGTILRLEWQYDGQQGYADFDRGDVKAIDKWKVESMPFVLTAMWDTEIFNFLKENGTMTAEHARTLKKNASVIRAEIDARIRKAACRGFDFIGTDTIDWQILELLTPGLIADGFEVGKLTISWRL